jgi:hypothetical protein
MAVLRIMTSGTRLGKRKEFETGGLGRMDDLGSMDRVDKARS